MKESILVRTILKYLGVKNILAWRNNSGMARYGGGPKERLVHFGMKGSPDIIAVDPNNGKIVCIECKGDKGKQSPEQWQFQLDVERSLGVYILARDLDDVIRYFEAD